MMSRDLVGELEREHDLETGAVSQLRDRHVDEAALQPLLDLLQQHPSATDGPVDGRLVRRLWWIPWIAEWQAQRQARDGKNVEHVRRAQRPSSSESSASPDPTNRGIPSDRDPQSRRRSSTRLNYPNSEHDATGPSKSSSEPIDITKKSR